MRIEYDPDKDIPVHQPAPLPQHIQRQLDAKFWAAREKYYQYRPLEYWPKELKPFSENTISQP